MKKKLLIFLALIITGLPAIAQEVSGTVTDENSRPLPGLNVIVKGTTTGAITDTEGRYSIRVADPDAILQFSYVGYLTEERTIAGQRIIDVQMFPDSRILEDVVVIGYGTARKEDLTSAISVVTAEEISRAPIPNLSRAIQGRAPGVVVYQDGSPGGGVNMRIRGIGSITQDPDPLYVVDGIIGADINAFSPQDIESVSILKDASASAIYGANGANGVVVITTKRGTMTGEPRVSLSVNLGTHLMPRHYDIMNADEYAAFYQEADELNGIEPPLAYSDSFREFYYDGDWNEGTDWQREILQPSFNQDYYVNVSNGNQKSNYSISANYQNEEGILLNTSSDRINLRANSDFRLGKYIQVGESLSITRRNSRNANGSAWGMSLESSPLMNVYNPDNKEGYEGAQIPFEYVTPSGDTTFVNNTGGNDKFNPRGVVAIPERRNTYDRIVGDIYLEIKPFQGLSFRTTPAVNAYISEDYNWTPSYDMGVRSQKEATLEHQNSRGHVLSWKNQLNFDRSFGLHHISATAVHQLFTGFNRNINATTTGYPYEQLNVISQSLPEARTVSGGEGESGELSYLVRVMYDFNSKYLITASVRRDGSYKFNLPMSNKWGTFPAASVAWKLNEDLLRNVDEINMLKLRFGFGMTGNSRIPAFMYETNLAEPIHFFPVFGENQSRAFAINELWNSGNPSIKWEAAQMTNIGVDLNAFGNKLQFSAEYYIKKQSDLIMKVPISRIHGKGLSGATADPFANIAEIDNRGFEFDLRYRKMEGRFNYSAFANLSTVKNEVIYVPSSLISDNNITRIGNTIGSIYGYVAEGIIQEDDFDEEGNYLHAIPAEGSPSPGDLKFADLNLDGEINDLDRTVIGKGVPDLTYSFGVECYFMGFDFSLFFYGIANAQIYNTMRRDLESFESQDLDHNKSTEWAASYYGRNGVPSTEFLRADKNDSNFNTRISTWWVEDASFLRLKDIQLGFTLPSSATRKVGMSTARIYVSGMNLLTFTGYKGYDPESPLNSNEPTLPGVDSNAYPIPRTLTAGIQLSF